MSERSEATGFVSEEIYRIAARLVDYDPVSGLMTWRNRDYDKRWNSRYAGKECGSFKHDGYRHLSIRVDGKDRRLFVHRLAWFIHHGCPPKGEIDHINHDHADNRISNLRDVDRLANARNLKMNSLNTSGVTGVYWHKVRRKWAAKVRMHSKIHCVGHFDGLPDAEAAITAFRVKHGFAPQHGLDATHEHNEGEGGE